MCCFPAIVSNHQISLLGQEKKVDCQREKRFRLADRVARSLAVSGMKSGPAVSFLSLIDGKWQNLRDQQMEVQLQHFCVQNTC